MKKRIPLLVGSIAVIGLAACTDPSYNPDKPNAHRNNGAIIGALAGGVFGATRKGGNKFGDAAAGAVIGGLIGGAAGDMMDRQAAELHRDLTTNGVQVVNHGGYLTVTMPQDVLFQTDSAVVRADLQRDLQTLAGSLNRYPNTTVQVIGNTDNTGDAAYNQRLSEQRAQAVAQVLIASGVNYARVQTVGRGESQPVASNLTPEGRAQNRRVEFVITPMN